MDQRFTLRSMDDEGRTVSLVPPRGMRVIDDVMVHGLWFEYTKATLSS